MCKSLKVISRESPLSLLQVKEVFGMLPNVEWELEAFSTYGDKHKEISLMENISPDFFSRELDEALLNGKADVAIHSAKDLPYPLPAGLELYALTEAKDKSDSLVSRDHLPLDKLPKGARIGTSSKARKAELLKWRDDLEIVSIRGTIEERISQVDAEQIDALIVATCALQRLGLSDRIAQRLPFRTHPLQGHLAITGRTGEPALKKIFEPIDIRSRYGKVTLVGFGPGNPDLITVAGERALKEADAILYDDLLDADYLSNFTGEKIYVGKRNGNHSIAQEEINRKLAELAFDGKRTVRLKGGDAMVFAHGREEIDYLQSVFIDVSVIPGVTAANALAAYSHIPLTHRGVSSSVALVSAHSTLGIQVPNAHTLVYYMGGTKLKEIAKALIKEGRDPMSAVALAYNISRPDQKLYYLHLYELEHLVMRIPTPILAIIGDVVLLDHDLSQDPILVTATDATKYVGLGKITHTPLIRIVPIDFSMPNYMDFDWIIFTSRYGVRHFLDRLIKENNDISDLRDIRIGSVGPTTTLKLSEYGIKPDFESPTSDAEGIIRYFKENKISDKQILIPRSVIGIKALKEELTALNNQVLDLPVYETIINEIAEKVDLSKFSRIYFASPSAVEAFISIYGKIPQSIPCIASGNTTENILISKYKHETI